MADFTIGASRCAEGVGSVGGPVAECILSGISLAYLKSIVLSRGSVMVGEVLGEVTTGVGVVFYTVPGFFDSDLVGYIVSFFLLYGLRGRVFRYILLTSRTLRAGPILGSNF